jgi:hypothetical protein
MDREHDVGVAGIDDEQHGQAAIFRPVADGARMTLPDELWIKAAPHGRWTGRSQMKAMQRRSRPRRCTVSSVKIGRQTPR